jgi:Domain of unknown function (DUF397)
MLVGGAEAAPDRSRAEWRKSSYSYVNTDCIEVSGNAVGTIKVRDSKNPRGHVLAFGSTEWGAFIRDVRSEA